MFFENALTAASQVAVLYIIVAVGCLADKVKFFTENIARQCTNLLFYIITPAVIVKSFLEIEHDSQTVRGFFIALGCGMLLHTVAITINAPLFRKGDCSKNSVLKFAAIYGNCGYMALPLANAVIGSQGVFYCSTVIISFQVFVFTHGVFIMDNAQGKKKKLNYKKIILNPGVLSVSVGLPLFLLGVKLPELIFEPIKYIASMNTPLAMLIFGTYLANTDFKSVFKEKRILLSALMKLIVLPLIMLVFFKLFGIRGELLTALIISASAPSANNTVIYTAKFGNDTSLAAQTVAVISFFSILTMPLMIAFAKTL
jgi:predicted permease